MVCFIYHSTPVLEHSQHSVITYWEKKKKKKKMEEEGDEEEGKEGKRKTTSNYPLL